MASRSTVRWVVVENRFPQVIRALEDRADLIVRKTAMDLEARAKMRAPVDTGVLRASISAAAVGPRHWRVTVGADYGWYLEMGTRFMRAQPYLGPAADEVWPAFTSAMRQVLA